MNKYNYNSIYKFNNSNQNKLNDSQIRILQHRLFSLDQIFKEISNYSNQKLTLQQLNDNIKNSTNVNFTDKDLTQFIASFNYYYQNSNFKEYMNQRKKLNNISLQYGGNYILELNFLELDKREINNLFKLLLDADWKGAINQKINLLV